MGLIKIKETETRVIELKKQKRSSKPGKQIKSIMAHNEQAKKPMYSPSEEAEWTDWSHELLG